LKNFAWMNSSVPDRPSDAVPPQRLLVFTRYPQAGKAKTRLIPALGEEGAANLHRQMAEHAIAQARKLRQLMPLSIEVWFTGASIEQMQAWLGDDLAYCLQPEGDLGDRLIHAFQTAFESGTTRAVVIGTDCPMLDAVLLKQAFDTLGRADLVLGPSTDGGYYLLGSRQFAPQLFQGIHWSTAEVLAQTLAISRQLQLQTHQLCPLSDVDYPDDLPVWDAATAKISVIVPVLNEAAHLAQTLATVQTGSQIESIVVDAGSQDDSCAIAQAAGAHVLSTAPGRAYQMNAGAAIATGEILLFLHADTCLPLGYDTQIRYQLAQPDIIAGAFDLRINGTVPGVRFVEWGVRQRSRWLQLPYGDQAIFVKASVFRAIDGFPKMPIMEDFALVKQLQKRGKIAIAPLTVQTSGRRWQKLGVLKTTLLNQAIILGYYLGIPPERLARWYRKAK